MSKPSEENRLNLFPYLYADFPLPLLRFPPAWLRAEAATRGQAHTSITEKRVTKGRGGGETGLQKASSIITARDIFKAHKAHGSALSLIVLNTLFAHSIPFQDQLSTLQASSPVRKCFIPSLPLPRFLRMFSCFLPSFRNAGGSPLCIFPLARGLAFRQLNARLGRDKVVSVAYRGRVILAESQPGPAQACSQGREGGFLPAR